MYDENNIQKFGGSKGVILPKSFADYMDLNFKDTITLEDSEKNGKRCIIITKKSD